MIPCLTRSRLKSLLALSALSLTSACATSGADMSRNLLEGNEAALRGDYATAVQKYEAALQAVPDSSAAKRNLGIVYVKAGNYKRARVLLKDAATAYPSDVEVFYFLGEANRGLEEYSAAVTHYQKAMRMDPTDNRITKALAWSWTKLGRYDRALTAALPLLKAQPRDLQARLIVGATFNKLGRHKDAIEVLSVVEKANFKVQSRDKVTADSERALLVTALAEAYAGAENCAKAASLYGEVLKTRPFLSTALAGAAHCDLRANATGRALDKLERATKVDPDMREAHFLLGKIYEKTNASKSAFYYNRFLLLAGNKPEFKEQAIAARSALANLEKR